MKNIDVNTKIMKNSDIVQKELDGIIYLMNPHEMTIHTLNDTAACIWTSFKTKTSINNLVVAVTEAFAVEKRIAERDVLVFVRTYIDLGMLRISSK